MDIDAENYLRGMGSPLELSAGSWGRVLNYQFFGESLGVGGQNFSFIG